MDTPPTDIYTLSLHDALPIFFFSSLLKCRQHSTVGAAMSNPRRAQRSEEHTSELQSRFDLVCRLLLEKKKKRIINDLTRHDSCTRHLVARDTVSHWLLLTSVW